MQVNYAKDIDKKLDDVLDIQPLIKKETTAEVFKEIQKHWDWLQIHKRKLIWPCWKREDAIEGILDVCKETENPRAYEVAGQLIKTVETEKLIDVQKKPKI